MLSVLHTIKFSILKQNVVKTATVRYCGSASTPPKPAQENFTFNFNGEDERRVRVRYAPSTTGHIHLNGLRLALYNYLFAKANKGTFILRIDDFDNIGFTQDVQQQQIFRHLEWAGIQPDESVIHGGDFGPYIQNQRLEIYQRSVKELLENGSAYYCFCTEKRLEKLKLAAVEAGNPVKYDNRCRDLTPLQVAEKLANKDTMCIRFKIDSDRFAGFDDIIQGHITSYVSSDGDPVIIKSDGHPTYHFANVIDDHMMQITHVLRDEKWLTTTPKQLSLYSAFGWQPPKYAHLPLILNADGTKMNRLHDHANVEYYREQKIFPLALLNYVASCGLGSQSQHTAQPKIHTIPELINTFDLKAVNKESNRFSAKHLDDYNRMELIRHIKDPELCENIVKLVKDLIKRTYPEHIKCLDLDDQHIRNVLNWSISTDHLRSLQQLVEGDLSFLWILPKVHDDNINSEWVNKLADALTKNQFDKKHLIELLQDFSKENNLKFGHLMSSLRHMLGGLKQGTPSAVDMMKILGKKTTIKRLLRGDDKSIDRN